MKIIRKIALVTFLSVLGLVTFIAASIFVDGWIGTRRLDSISNASMASTGGSAVRAYVARPAGAGPHPTVIMIHEFWGLNIEMRDKADLLARAGYVVVVPSTKPSRRHKRSATQTLMQFMPGLSSSRK